MRSKIWSKLIFCKIVCDTPIARINHFLYAWCWVWAVRLVGKEGALEGGGGMNESCVMDA